MLKFVVSWKMREHFLCPVEKNLTVILGLSISILCIQLYAQSMNIQCKGLNPFVAKTKRRNPLGGDSQDVLGSAEDNAEGVGRRRRRSTPNAAANHSKRTAGEDDDIFFYVQELHEGQVVNDGAIKFIDIESHHGIHCCFVRSLEMPEVGQMGSELREGLIRNSKRQKIAHLPRVTSH